MANAFPLSPALLSSGGGGGYPAVQPGIFRPRGDFWSEVGTMENMTVRGVAKVLGTGAFASGQESYNNGVGFFLEANDGTPRFSLGDSAGDNMTWDGSQLAISGALTATSGAIGGWTVNANDLTGGNAVLKSAGQLELGTINDLVKMDAADPTYRLWVGNAVGGLSPFRVDKAGQATMTNINVTGGSVAGATVGSGIAGGNINTGSVDTAQLAANSVTATEINVSQLSAISADVGTINAGTINAVSMTVQNLDFGMMQQVGTLGADQNLGVADITVNSTGRINFGSGASDYLANDILHFEVAASQVARVEAKNGANSAGSIQFQQSGTQGAAYLIGEYSSGSSYVGAIGSSTTNLNQAFIVATNSSGQNRASVVVNGSDSITFKGGAAGASTYATFGLTNRALSLYGRLYPGTGSGTQTARYIYDANSRTTFVGEVDIASIITYGQIASTGGSGSLPVPVARMAFKDAGGTTWWVPAFSAYSPWAA